MSRLLSLWTQLCQAEDLVSREARPMAGATAAVRPSEEAQGGCLAGCELRALEQTAVSSVVLGSGWPEVQCVCACVCGLSYFSVRTASSVVIENEDSALSLRDAH